MATLTGPLVERLGLRAFLADGSLAVLLALSWWSFARHVAPLRVGDVAMQTSRRAVAPSGTNERP